MLKNKYRLLSKGWRCLHKCQSLPLLCWELSPAGCFYLLWLQQLMFVSPSLSLLHPLPHHSQQSASCPLLLKFHPEISHREQSVPVVGTRPCVCVFFCFFFVIFFSLFLSWSMKICSTFCHPFLHLLSPPGAALLFFFCFFFSPLHLFSFPSLSSSFPPRSASVQSVNSPHTQKKDLSLLHVTTGTAP